MSLYFLKKAQQITVSGRVCSQDVEHPYLFLPNESRFVTIMQSELNFTNTLHDAGGAFVGQQVGSLVARVTCVTFNPVPDNVMLTAMHQRV